MWLTGSAIDDDLLEAADAALNDRWARYLTEVLRPGLQHAATRHAFGSDDRAAQEHRHSVTYHLGRTLDDYARRISKLVIRTGPFGIISRLNVHRTTDELNAMKRSVEGSFDGPLGEVVVAAERLLADTLPFADLDALLDDARLSLGIPTPLPPVAERVRGADVQRGIREPALAFLRAPQQAIGRKVREHAADMQRHAADGHYLYVLDHSPHRVLRAEIARRLEAEKHLHWFAVAAGAKPPQHSESVLPQLETWLHEHLVMAPLRDLEALAAGPAPTSEPPAPPDPAAPGDALAERRRQAAAQRGDLRVESEREVVLDGCRGTCLNLYHRYPFTGRDDVDEALSRFPVALFLPDGFGVRRPAHETPVVLAMGGIGAPYEWNGFILPTLLEMGIAVVLLESPLAGQRGLVRNAPADLGRELRPLIDRGIPFNAAFLARLMDGVARDTRAVFGLLGEQYDLLDPRQALFGVSMGTLFTAFGFMRDGLGQRLLGIIGHGDLAAFARSYFAPFTTLAGTPLGPILEMMGGPVNDLARRFGMHDVAAFIPFARMLRQVADHPHEAANANPFTFVGRVAEDRPVRYLVGGKDNLCLPGDTRIVSAVIANGATETVPGMGHEARIPDTRAFIQRHLTDWRG